jgi:hypothetical protein
MRGLLANDFAHLLGSADRNGTLVDDDAIAVHRAPDFTGDVEHVAQVRRTVLPRRSADGNEDDLRAAHAARQVGRKGQPLLAAVAAHHLLEARLVDGNAPALQQPDLGGVLVDADDVVSVLGQTGAGDKADIAGANDCDFHPVTTPEPSSKP